MPIQQRKVRGKSLNLISADNPVRQFLGKLFSHTAFEIFIMLMIVCSTVLLFFETPLVDPHSVLYKIEKSSDIFFTAVFAIEAVLKIIAYGFACNGKHSYLYGLWNILDFLIVLGSILDLWLGDTFTGVRVIRVIRIFRPIRIVTRNQRLQLALQALMKSMTLIIELQLLTMFFLFMLAISQTMMYSGKFHHCYTEHLPDFNGWRTR